MPDPVTHRIRASAAGDCRKALYLHATGVAIRNDKTRRSTTA